MIKINLAQKKQASYAAGSTAKMGSFGKSLGSSASSSELMALLSRILIPVVFCAVAYFAFDSHLQGRIKEMQAETDTQMKEKMKVQSELTKVSGFEVQKAELKRTEDMLLNKVNTVEKLIRGKDRALKELIGIAQALPKDVWLTSIEATDTRLSIRGNAEDMGLVSDVMTKLEGSIYFKGVSLTKSTTDASGTQASFEVTAGRE